MALNPQHYNQSMESSTTYNATSSHPKQMQPTTIQEEQEQLNTPLIESRMNTTYQPAPASDAITFTAIKETEKCSLSDDASGLID